MKNPMNLLRTEAEGQKKRKELTSIVEQTFSKEDRKKLKVEWTKMLYGYLSIGSLVFDDEHILSLYTLNFNKKDHTNLKLNGFNAINVVVIAPEYKKMAYRLCIALEEKKYNTQVKELGKGEIQEITG